MDIADEIAYDNHDIDDGLTSNLLKESDLETLPIWNKIAKDITKKYAKIEPEKIKYHLEKAYYLAKNGRQGPVWLDIPLDVPNHLLP